MSAQPENKEEARQLIEMSRDTEQKSYYKPSHYKKTCPIDGCGKKVWARGMHVHMARKHATRNWGTGLTKKNHEEAGAINGSIRGL